ncbi:MAG: 16S rRNA (guanine(527)-N(7))-methyltransferase RsmG [Cyclobacteriaceae bacterium]|nr:16S rRNA (guanine(527)-N(7))-methyltransferase RsmG [Cyclobacteriaceae bacterium]
MANFNTSTLQHISTYFPLSLRQQQQFSQLGPLYREWNEKINVVSRKDIDNLYVNHVLHSLGIAKVIAFRKGAAILDVGTGGGFPGIPLAIFFPDTHFHLVDSIGKKITVVKAVAEAVGLTNVTAEQVRAETLKGEYDFVVTRAVARLKELYRWTNKLIKKQSVHTLPNGILALKGGDLAEEIAEVRRPTKLFALSDYFAEPYFETKFVVHVAHG